MIKRNKVRIQILVTQIVEQPWADKESLRKKLEETWKRNEDPIDLLKHQFQWESTENSRHVSRRRFKKKISSKKIKLENFTSIGIAASIIIFGITPCKTILWKPSELQR
jgi:hypothetical protein